MDWQGFDTWLSRANLLWIAVILFSAMSIAAAIGVVLHKPHRLRVADGEATEIEGSQEGYIVTAVLGLLALLLGFTFSLATDRFDARRLLVLEEANAIGTVYLRAQLLPEPHRTRMTHLLIRYTDNRINLAKAPPGSTQQQRLLQISDGLLTDVWAATSASFDSIKALPFSNTYIGSVNALIDLDSSRKAARAARVPGEVFAVLFIYMITTAGVLGYVLSSRGGRLAAGFLLALLTLSLMLIIDINRPVLGGIVESQQPMEDLLKSLTSQPTTVFDKWRPPAAP